MDKKTKYGFLILKRIANVVANNHISGSNKNIAKKILFLLNPKKFGLKSRERFFLPIMKIIGRCPISVTLEVAKGVAELSLNAYMSSDLINTLLFYVGYDKNSNDLDYDDRKLRDAIISKLENRIKKLSAN